MAILFVGVIVNPAPLAFASSYVFPFSKSEKYFSIVKLYSAFFILFIFNNIVLSAVTSTFDPSEHFTSVTLNIPFSYPTVTYNFMLFNGI